MYRISFDKYVYASVEAKQQHLNTNIREGNYTTKAIQSYILKAK